MHGAAAFPLGLCLLCSGILGTLGISCFGDGGTVCPGSVCQAPAFQPEDAALNQKAKLGFDLEGVWSGDTAHPAATGMQRGLSGLLLGFTGEMDDYGSTYSANGLHTAYNFYDDSYSRQTTRALIAQYYKTYVVTHGKNFKFTTPPQAYNASEAFRQSNCIIEPSEGRPGYHFFTFKSDVFTWAGGTAIFDSDGGVVRQHSVLTTNQRFDGEPGNIPGVVYIAKHRIAKGDGPVHAALAKYWKAIKDADAKAIAELFAKDAKLHVYNAAEDINDFRVYSTKAEIKSHYERLFFRFGSSFTVESKLQIADENNMDPFVPGNAFVAWTCSSCEYDANMSSTLVFGSDGKIHGEGAECSVPAFKLPAPAWMDWATVTFIVLGMGIPRIPKLMGWKL